MHFSSRRTTAAMLACACVLGALWPDAAWALGRSLFTDEEIFALRQTFKYRIEAAGTFEYLDPNTQFGNWGSGYLHFAARPVPEVTVWCQATGFTRPENEFDAASNAFLGTVGLAASPHENVYFNTSASYGTNASYLPVIRVDEAMSLAIPASELVTVALEPGGLYSRYHTDAEVYGAYLGPAVYIGPWNVGYQVIVSKSTEDNLFSFSHVVFFGYDLDGWFETNLTASFGDTNFLSLYLADPKTVRDDKYLEARASHRQWIGVDWGLLAVLGYLNLFNEVSKWDATLGVFVEF
jgi:YaiO family outer membrane protein